MAGELSVSPTDFYTTLNSTITGPITLVNPHTNPITVNVTTVNPHHFYLAQDAKQVHMNIPQCVQQINLFVQIVINPNSSLEVPVIFKPSKFGDQHKGEIKFTSKEVILFIISQYLSYAPCSLASKCLNSRAMDYTPV